MNNLDRWLIGKFPEITPRDIAKLKNRFPRIPDHVVEFFQQCRGGKFRRVCEAAGSSFPIRTFSVGTDWWIDVFGIHDAHVLDREASELTNYNPEDLVPIFMGQSHSWIFFDCASKSVINEDDEEGMVEVCSKSLDEYLNSIQLKKLEDYEKGNEIDDLITLCEDDKVLQRSDAELRRFTSDCQEGWRERQINVLHRAVVDDRVNLAKGLVKRGFDPLETDAEENTCFHTAVRSASIDSLKFLTKHYPDGIDLVNSEGETPLQYAVQELLPREAMWLVHCGADINKKVDGLDLREYVQRTRDKHNRYLAKYLESGTFKGDF